MRGVPVSPKCPKCKRGKWGHAPINKGVRKHRDKLRERWSTGGRGHSYFRGQMLIECLDCGHTWWSTLYTEEVRRLLRELRA
jgi:hypothetical protein